MPAGLHASHGGSELNVPTTASAQTAGVSDVVMRAVAVSWRGWIGASGLTAQARLAPRSQTVCYHVTTPDEARATEVSCPPQAPRPAAMRSWEVMQRARTK